MVRGFLARRFEHQAHQAAGSARLLAREVGLRIVGQAGIEHASYIRMFAQGIGDTFRAMLMAFHAYRQCPQSRSSSHAANGSSIAPSRQPSSKVIFRIRSVLPTTTPATISLCPPKYFVAEWTTRSIPCAKRVLENGRCPRVVNNGCRGPVRGQVGQSRSESCCFITRVEGDSRYSSVVFGRSASAHSCHMSLPSTNVTSTLNRFR